MAFGQAQEARDDLVSTAKTAFAANGGADMTTLRSLFAAGGGDKSSNNPSSRFKVRMGGQSEKHQREVDCLLLGLSLPACRLFTQTLVFRSASVPHPRKLRVRIPKNRPIGSCHGSHSVLGVGRLLGLIRRGDRVAVRFGGTRPFVCPQSPLALLTTSTIATKLTTGR